MLKVAIRGIRRDAMDEAKKQEKVKRNHRRWIEGSWDQKLRMMLAKHVDEMTAHKEKIDGSLIHPNHYRKKTRSWHCWLGFISIILVKRQEEKKETWIQI